ncbi:MAG: hypothetical protein K9N07_11190 [Candidatus Cloacimonetes bacterium]|nr:hypothetical protein [Candidatus Cloacimonadota bacterium]
MKFVESSIIFSSMLFILFGCSSIGSVEAGYAGATVKVTFKEVSKENQGVLNDFNTNYLKEGWIDITEELEDWERYDDSNEMTLQRDEETNMIIINRNSTLGNSYICKRTNKLGEFKFLAQIKTEKIKVGQGTFADGKFHAYQVKKNRNPNSTGYNWSPSDFSTNFDWTTKVVPIINTNKNLTTVFRIALQGTSGTIYIKNIRILYKPAK